MKRIVVVGGGISGLATAHRLLEQAKSLASPVEILLLEASDRLGGIIQTDYRERFLLERGPDSFISEKPAAIELAKKLGIEKRLIGTNSTRRRSFIVRNGRLLPVPDGFYLLAPTRFWPFLSSGVFSLQGKLRMAWELALPRRHQNGETDESLAQFVRRRFGHEALSRMAQPMVGGIYTADPENLSLRATFPRFLEMEARHRSIILALLKAGRSQQRETSGARYSLFLSFDRGMQVLVDALVKRISDFAEESDRPVTSVRLNTPVAQLTRKPESSQWKIELKDGSDLVADAVCLAVSAQTAAKLLANIEHGLAARLGEIRHASTATINLAYRREDIPHSLNGFGFVVPVTEQRSLLACTFSSIKFEGRAPTNYVLLRAFVGGALQPEIFALEDAEMVARVTNDLRDLIGVQSAPLFAEITRWPNSMPQYEIGHLKRVHQIKQELEPLTNLKVTGNAFDGPGIPDCIRNGETAADELLKGL